VVMVEYPRQGVWSIGFVTGTLSQSLQSHLDQPMLNVFIPTTPNPTSGWYAIIPEADVVNLSISIEDAFKVLISGGIVTPKPAPASKNTKTASYSPIPVDVPLLKEKHQEIPLELEESS
ncbi:MAG: DUF502 domain-containing protein, partial [Microcystaceae cyanobacterium]